MTADAHARRRLLAVLWTAGILAACSLPGRALPAAPLLGFDKLVHFALFAGLGTLWMTALRMPVRARLAVVLAVGTGYAWFTEVWQALLPFGRTADPYDALADVAGLLIAALLTAAVERQRRR